MVLVWTKEALNKLKEIEDFIAKDNPTIAIRFVDYLINQTETLRNYPNSGRIVPEIGNEDIRELVLKNYRIIYKISEKSINILTIFEGHRLLRNNELL
jgi:toxin ParE1/3/4